MNFYTYNNGYKKFADKLITSLKKFNLSYYIYEIHDLNDKWVEVKIHKGFPILEVMKKFPNRNIVWVDADSIIEKDPVLFNEIDADLSVSYVPHMNQTNTAVIFIRNNEYMIKFINEWYNKSKEHVKLGRKGLGGQDVLQDMLRNNDLNIKDHYKPLDPAYCIIFDNDNYNGIEGIITQWQASRGHTNK